VMRRAVGDKKLTYLGFSYGSALGQYYANMFPDRFRALAVDGVINPTAWVGSSRTKNVVQDDRLRSADGAYKALMEILKRCQQAGEEYCEFAAGDPVARFATITRRLKAKPLTLALPLIGTVKLTYADFIGGVLSGLYMPTAGEDVAMIAQAMWVLTSTHPSSASPEVAAAKLSLARRIKAGRDFPYFNDAEAFSGVMCSDGLHPKNANDWVKFSADADRRAPYFGRLWSWNSAQCARSTWTVRDEDAYRGPFNRRTAATVLVVGSYWDPATNYNDAVSSARLLPNSRLLTSDNFGHTAYGTGACATGVIDKYLLRGTLPAVGTLCHAAAKPFAEPLLTDPLLTDPLLTDPLNGEVPALLGASKSDVAAMGLPESDEAKVLPPVGGRTIGARSGR
jgi:pimeloyl-ACP methyl ester carboxylesterase